MPPGLSSTTHSIVLDKGGTITLVIALPAGHRPGGTTVILAHGAGNDMHSPFLCSMHEGLARRGFASVKFNFPYTERGRRAPDPAVVLEACYRQVIDLVRDHPGLAPRQLIIGGKSMGGRMASHLAAAGVACDGLLFLGYPLHPAGKPEQLRVAHLERISAPMLFFAGTRDPLCRLDLLEGQIERLRRDHGSQISLHVIDGGDHSFALPRSTRRSAEDVHAEILDAAAAWVESARAG